MTVPAGAPPDPPPELPASDAVAAEAGRWGRRRLRSAIPPAWRRPLALVGLAVIGAWVVIAIFVPLIAPYNPLAQQFNILASPSAAHWFGTDEIGRDVLSRVIFGARASLLAGVVSVLISLSIGVPVRIP